MLPVINQLMSFLRSIGPLMERSDLCAALENVYAPVTIGHMFSGKAFARAIRGRMLCPSALSSLLLEEFWGSISSKKKIQLAKIFDMFNLTLIEPSNSVKCHGLKTRSLNYHLNLAPQPSLLTIHNTYQLYSSLSEQNEQVTGSYMLKPQNTCCTFLLLLVITTMQRLADFIFNQQYHWRRIIHIHLSSLC